MWNFTSIKKVICIYIKYSLHLKLQGKSCINVLQQSWILYNQYMGEKNLNWVSVIPKVTGYSILAENIITKLYFNLTF